MQWSIGSRVISGRRRIPSSHGALDVGLADLSRIAGLWKSASNRRRVLAMLIAVSFIFLCNGAFAADKIPHYQVIPGSDDKAYLLDTATGFVWVLTYRTLATGREPVTIPYKFIKISPKNQKDFMVEDTQNVPMPLSRIP
ncbi:MAG TPA: hypothetical protein VF343_08500 [Syntrophales bacterium]